MKKLLILFAVAFLLSLTFASASDFYYKQGESIDIKMPCYMGGAYCDVSFTCSLTAQYPKTSQIFIDNQVMTRNPSYYNYTINNSNTYGIYPASMSCSNGTLSGKSDFTFEITPTGEILSTSDSFLYIGILSLLIILFILSITKIFTASSLAWLYGCISISYFLLIGIIFISGKIVNNFIPSLPAIGAFLDTALTILIVGLFPLIIFLVLSLFYKAFNEKEIGKMQDMGYTAEEIKRYR